MSPIARLTDFQGNDDPRLTAALEFKKLTREDVIIVHKPNTDTVVIIDDRLRLHKPG